MPLERFRSYLHVLARSELDGPLAARLDASDLVQQSLLEAHRDQGAFRGETLREQAAWLRRILARNLANAVRDQRRQRRDPARERPLDAADGLLDRTEARLGSRLAAAGPSPSSVAASHESLLRLSEHLAALPADQQRAVVLRHWEGASLAEIADRMQRTPASVAGLLHRGLAALRAALADLHPDAG